MTPLRHAAGLSLVFAFACPAPPAGREPAAAPPIAASPVAPAAAPAPVVEVPAPPAAGCRALVNLEAQGHRVVDLKLGAPHQAAVGEGLVARLDDGRSFALGVVTHEKSGKNRHGTGEAKWDILMMAPIPGGKYGVLYGEEPELVLPDGDTPGAFDETRTITVVGLFGPHISVMTSDSGYGGGAHGFDDMGYATLRLPDGEAVGLDALGPDALAAAAASITRTNEERREQGLEEIDAPKDLARFGLALTRGSMLDPPPPAEAGLELRTVVSCCTWAENHNMFFLAAPLERPPPGLERQFRVGATARARFEAPDGCGAVGFAEGKLWARLGSEGEPRPLELPGVVASALLGVHWIPASDPFSLAQLPAPPEVVRAFARLGPEDESRIAAAYLGPGDTLAHPMFRGDFGPDPATILVFKRNDARGPSELSGFALVPEGDGHRKLELPSFAAGQYNLSLDALLFDNLDADAAREIIVMGVYVHGIGPEAGQTYQWNHALDWDGTAFVEMKQLAPKIGTAGSAAKLRKALQAKD